MLDALVEGGLASAVVDVEEVGENAGQHLPRGGGSQMPILQLLVLAAEDFFAVAVGENAAVMEGIEEDGAVAGQEMSGQINPFDRCPGALADEYVDKGQADGDALARVEDAGQEGVAVVVVVVGVANKHELTGEEIGHDIDAVAVAGGAVEAAGQLAAPGIEPVAVGGGFEASQQGGPEQPGGLFEVGIFSEDRAERREALEGLGLHDLVEDVAGVEGGQRIIAKGKVAQVLDISRPVLGQLLFDQ